MAAPLANAGSLQAVITKGGVTDTHFDSYLNTLDKVRGRFIQISSDGGTAEGVFFVDRPGKMRFDYDPPVPILMIADNSTFVYYDQELEEATLIPLWSTPLWFLLDEETRLNDRVLVKHISQGPNLTTYTLIDPEGDQSGELDLVFNNQPWQLKQWVVRDSHGVTTEITLVNVQTGVEIDEDRFTWRHLPGANKIEELQNRDQDR